jgi:hypothetical protein
MSDAFHLFEEFQPEAAATPEQVAALAVFAQRPLPSSYQLFLLASNGGWGRSGEREFGLFGTEEVVRYAQDYKFAEYMPGALPFALDGGGSFYVFDLRAAPDARGKYPVVTCGSGTNTWDMAEALTPSFPEACRG